MSDNKQYDRIDMHMHVGMEYAIPTSDDRTKSYDFLSWSGWEAVWNLLRGKKRWYTPDVRKIRSNLEAGLQAGAIIIFAHCGLPYYAPRFLSFLEHSDFKVVRRYLKRTHRGEFTGRCYADVSACCTPFRKSYFRDIMKLPPELLLFGSDFPTPAFELSADLKEIQRDFKAILKGKFDRIIIPQDNLLGVNYRELQHFFPGHQMFTNFVKLIYA